MNVRQPRPLASEPARVIESPYLNAKEAAIYLRYKSARVLYKAISRGLDVPVVHRGASLLFHRDQLDRWLAGEPRLEIMKQARSRHRQG